MNMIRKTRQLLAGTALVAACLALVPAATRAADVNNLMTKALGTTDDPGPVIANSFKRAAMDLQLRSSGHSR